jgi:uncharacterized lipoprotein YehR (DUF1307 family)
MGGGADPPSCGLSAQERRRINPDEKEHENSVGWGIQECVKSAFSVTEFFRKKETPSFSITKNTSHPCTPYTYKYQKQVKSSSISTRTYCTCVLGARAVFSSCSEHGNLLEGV